MTDIHLVVFQHGLWGNPKHLKYLTDTFGMRHVETVVFNSHVNEGFKTYDGIDVCGERLIASLLTFISELKIKEKLVSKISFVGYSLGGLILRFAIGKLFVDGFFDKIEPVHFVTFATPHLGSNRPEISLWNRLYNSISSFLTFKTGNQINLHDKYHRGLPLLYVMSDPAYPFIQALRKFKVRKCYANVRNDRIVRYTTASISHSNHYRKHGHIGVDPKYPSIVNFQVGEPLAPDDWNRKEISVVAMSLVLAPILLPFGITVATTVLLSVRLFRPLIYTTSTSTAWLDEISLKNEKFEIHRAEYRNSMIYALDQLGWQRISVNLRFTNAHAAIIVRNKRFSGYKDVVNHFIDHFDLKD